MVGPEGGFVGEAPAPRAARAEAGEARAEPGRMTREALAATATEAPARRTASRRLTPARAVSGWTESESARGVGSSSAEMAAARGERRRRCQLARRGPSWRDSGGREDATRARGASAAGVGANARADAADMVASEARREVSLRPRCVPRATSHSRASSRLGSRALIHVHEC